MGELSAAERDKLPASAFVFASTRRYPIHDRSHAENALARASGKPEEAEVKAAVYRKYPALKKAEVEIRVPLWKDEARQLVYGVVLSPGIYDSQGDICDAADIEKAAHRFLVEYRKHDVQHAEETAGVETVESFIAPCDLEIAGKQVLKGAWVLVTHVTDPEVWEQVQKGDLGGYSMGGSGTRLMEAAA